MIKKKNRSIFVSFFPVRPENMGSATVVNNRFKFWPGQKKLIQITHINKKKYSNTKSIFIKRENPINKITSLPKIIIEVFKYLRKDKNNLLLIEGASWIFYSFIIIFFFKFFYSPIKIIYISHAIESEIRKKFSNYLIFILTKILEFFVFKLADISTAVSKSEQSKIFRLYKTKTILFPNSINTDLKYNKKINIKNYIIYNGSYSYKPNQEAIDFINVKLMPELLKIYPNLKFVITGGGFKEKFKWLINKNIVSKNELFALIKKSLCTVIPLKFGSGTRVKILENLFLGSIVISSKVGIEGIELKNTNPPYIFKNQNDLIKILKFVIKNNKKIKKRANKYSNFYKKKYSMKNNVKNFLYNMERQLQK